MAQHDSKATDRAKRRRIRRRFIKAVTAVVVIAVIAFLAYGYFTTKNELQKAKNPTQAAKNEARDVEKQIGKYLDLPTNEKPTVATVKDKSKLQDQAFFEKAENGDKVLVYTKAQRAVLYRPSTKKVIEYAPVNLDSRSTTSGNQNTPSLTAPANAQPSQ